MNKLSIFIVSLIFMCPGIGMAADAAHTAAEDRALVAASFQQGEDADPAAPVLTKQEVKEPVSESKPVMAEAIPPDNKEQNNDISNQIMVFTQLITELQNNQSAIRQQQKSTQEAIEKQGYLLITLTVLLLIFGILLLLVYRKKKSVNLPQEIKFEKPSKIDNDTQAEYDFMGSSEAIPAKLDLARAYIAMEDYTAARETLAEILGEGNEENRREAERLLSKISC